MPNWTGFAAAILALTLLLLVLARRSQRVLERIAEDRERIDIEEQGRIAAEDRDRIDDHGFDGDASVRVESEPEGAGERKRSDGRDGTDSLDVERADRVSTSALFVNVAVTQAAVLLVIVAIAWGYGVPASDFGVETGAGIGLRPIGYGIVAGIGLYLLDDVAAALGERAGYQASERLRETLAPSTRSEWVTLFVVVLPTIAVTEETLFRGALIGAFAAGFGADPWLLAVGSSLLFGFGHGAQGRVGIVVTGVLGFALAGVFVHTGSLLVVIVAHYVVNATEFLGHEGLGRAPGDVLRPE
ncbi:lysostaphin resistance A-like protein [Halopenitus sp. H-Gu1]|uniref:CPBP family intramembrane glutamic endopeptidase n=1 Tax=Halopenitus sp. H-Gu1 TaxID=3242697 RepID=UPI00359D6B07